MNTVDDLSSSRVCAAPPSAPTEGKTKAVRATPERMRHGQTLSVSRGVQRVQGGVAVLLRSGTITPAHQAAAERYHRDYATGILGITDTDANRACSGGGDLHTSMLARAAAVGRVRTIRKALSDGGTKRLQMLVLDEVSFRAMGAALYPGDATGGKMAQAQCVLLLEQLAALYADMDRERRPANGNRQKQDAS